MRVAGGEVERPSVCDETLAGEAQLPAFGREVGVL
jgi:hypothetical protein